MTEQTNHPTWTNVRIRNLLKLHEQRPGGLVTIANAEDVCKRVRNELAAESDALRKHLAGACEANGELTIAVNQLQAELATLQAANAAAKQLQPLPRRVEIDLFGHVDD